MIGRTVGHYQILDKLGEGGMGVVYRAKDTKLNRTVALKFVPPDALGDPDLRTRFCQEAQAAAALSHPNVCTVFEIDEECGFLAMEFVEGETVQARVRRRPLPIPEALDLAMQAAQGLQAAHEKGVVHRDIKSANLMVTPQGAVKIMDFGLARLTGRTRVTRTGTAVGTPAYMSPEQARGKAVDRRTDLWSLGVVLYEMVAGQLPFRGDSEAAVAHSILHEDPEPVSALRAGLPLELDRVIAKALAKDAGERYQHAEDLLVDLRTLRGRLQQEAKEVRRAATAATVGSGSRPWPWIAAAAVAMTVALAIAVHFLSGPRQALLTTFTVFPEEKTALTGHVAVSPDGRRIVFAARDSAGNSQLWLRALDSVEMRRLPGTEGAQQAHWSPDGRWVGFFDPFKLKRIDVASLDFHSTLVT